MRRKLRTKRGRQSYALRMQTVEPVFGRIKQGRGFRQFLLRSLEKVNREWLLICTGHNPESSSGQALLKLFRFGGRLTAKLPGKGLDCGPTRNTKESPSSRNGAILQRLSAGPQLPPARIVVAAC